MDMALEVNNRDGHRPLTSSYRPEIDGLRALAIAAVIINHFNKDILPSGYLGVDIFFVISGFVTISSLARRSNNNLGYFLIDFYSRRMQRLIPALAFCILVTSILICLFDPNPNSSIRTGIAALFGFSNLSLLNQATDYFADSTELNVFTHTWSLGVETQFYILLPLLAWLFGLSQLNTRGNKKIILATGILSVASLVGFISLYPTNQSASYFLMTTRLWELGAGCLLFLGMSSESKILSDLSRFPPLAIIATIVALFFLPQKFAIQATIAVVELTVVLLICLRPGTGAYRFFSNSKVVYIGLISYSLYLWHWSVLSLSRWTIGVHWWLIPIQIILIWLLSVASYHFIEDPLRRVKWAPTQWQSIAYALLVCTSIASLITGFIAIPNLSLYVGKHPSLIESGVQSLSNAYHLNGTDFSWGGNDCILSENEQARQGKELPLDKCVLGDFIKAERRVMIFGNSFSAAFVQGFDDLVKLDKYAVVITSSWDASPVKEMPNLGMWSEASSYYWNSIFPSLVNSLKPNDWVFLMNDLAWLSPEKPSPASEKSLKQLEQGLENLSQQLSEKDIHLAVLHGNPFAREAGCKPAIAAKQWFQPFGGLCKIPDKAESLSRRQALDDILVSLERQGKIHIVDLFDTFCPKKICTYNAANGDLLYRDEYSHPSVEGARLSAPIIHQLLTSI